MSKKNWKNIKETIFMVVSSLSFALMARTAIAEPRYIPSESMTPGLQIEDRLLIDKFTPWLGDPERGDIVVFTPPYLDIEPENWQESFAQWHGYGKFTPLIKRVVGLPGETLEVKEGQVFINGKIIQEKYLENPPFYEFGPFTVPQDHVFVLGDNRNNSADSHIWGPLPIKNIKGKSIFRFWPPSRIGITY